LLRFLAAPRATRAFSDDLLQECWLQIHRSRHTYRPDAPLLPWIFGIAFHVRRNAYRHLSREQARNQCDFSWQGNVSSDEAGVLSGLLCRLPDSQRQVVEMLKLEGKSLVEVASATSSTVGAVKQRAHRAYLNLRHLGRSGILEE
jgi:RNA polymerase sigma-70 factor (ECF subfamily)